MAITCQPFVHWGAFWQRSWGPNFNYDDEYKRQKRSYRAMKNLTAKYVGMREESEAVYQLQSQRGWPCTNGILIDIAARHQAAKRLNSWDTNRLHVIKWVKSSALIILGPDHVMENSSLLFSSCHQKLVISENSRFFAFYLNK